MLTFGTSGSSDGGGSAACQSIHYGNVVAVRSTYWEFLPRYEYMYSSHPAYMYCT